MFAVSFQFKELRLCRLAFLLMAKSLRNRFEIVLTAFAVSFITIGLLRWENYVYPRSIWSKESSRSRLIANTSYPNYCQTMFQLQRER